MKDNITNTDADYNDIKFFCEDIVYERYFVQLILNEIFGDKQTTSLACWCKFIDRLNLSSKVTQELVEYYKLHYEANVSVVNERTVIECLSILFQSNPGEW